MHIVIVDDTQINVVLIQHLVKRLEGCTSVGFLDSQEGLDYCAAHDPDLVVVDYMMPAPDGMQFVEQFRQMPGKADTPVLMVTANSESEVRYRALQSGVTDFLTKPIDKNEIGRAHV